MMERETSLSRTKFHLVLMQIEGACGWHGVLIPLWTGRAENALTKLTLPYCAGPKPLKMGGIEIGHTPHVETSQGWGPCPCMLAWGLFSVMLLPPPCCWSQAVTAMDFK